MAVAVRVPVPDPLEVLEGGRLCVCLEVLDAVLVALTERDAVEVAEPERDRAEELVDVVDPEADFDTWVLRDITGDAVVVLEELVVELTERVEVVVFDTVVLLVVVRVKGAV